LIPPVIFVTAMILVHMIDGRPVRVNPATITQLAPPATAEHTQLPPGVHCVLGLVDGRYLSVAEECAEVERLIARVDPKP